MLLNSCGKSTLNPGMLIVNSIMGCLDVVPPQYAIIRKIVCEVFGISPWLVLEKGIEHSIVYLSPLVNNLSDARYFLVGEIHGPEQFASIEEVARLANRAAFKLLGCVKNSIFFLEYGNQRLEDKQPIPDPKLFLNKLKIPGECVQHCSFYGWDDPNSISSRSGVTAIRLVQIKEHMEASPGDIPVSLRLEMMSLQLLFAQLTLTNFTDFNKDFPGRTRAMRLALEEAEKGVKQKTITGHILLVAGVSHFDQQWGNEQNPNCSLAILYDLLKTIPAIVIYPKVLDDNSQELMSALRLAQISRDQLMERPAKN